MTKLARNSQPREQAELYQAREVIDPGDSRNYLIDMLDIYRHRMTRGIGEHLMRAWPTSYVQEVEGTPLEPSVYATFANSSRASCSIRVPSKKPGFGAA